MKVNRTLWRWSRLVHIHAAISLLVLLSFFAVTGFTLNHPSWFVGSAVEVEAKFLLPNFESGQGLKFSPEQIKWLEQGVDVNFSDLSIEQDGDIAFLDAQMPGSFVSGEIDLNSGEVLATSTRYGFVAVLNDLHKGRHAGLIWTIFLDLSSLIVTLFCLSGFVLLMPSKKYFRPAMYIGSVSVAVVVILAMLIL